MSAPTRDSHAASASGSTTPRAIGSLAKKQSDVTRHGTQKLKFTPVLPARRKKEEPKTELAPAPLPESSNGPARARGRGRGGMDAGLGRGRGRGRGAAPPTEMTASGPFAMGPALVGSQARRSTGGRSDSIPAVPTPLLSSVSASLGENLTQTAAPTLRTLESSGVKGKEKVKEEEEEYSDPDEGVEIIDMSRIRDMDWMAPESLREDRQAGKVEKEESSTVDLTNALNLNESDNEEELEDLIEDFAVQGNLDGGHALREDRLYFFQFPDPFPNFTNNSTSTLLARPESSTELGTAPPLPSEPPAKKVSFAPDTKPSLTPNSSRTSTAPPESVQEEPVDGVIGQLEVYKSGAVKIRLTNGILLDVNAASQPSFLQHAAYLDIRSKQFAVLGEVNKQFVISPDVESLLEDMERTDRSPPVLEGEEDLIKMDIT